MWTHRNLAGTTSAMRTAVLLLSGLLSIYGGHAFLPAASPSRSALGRPAVRSSRPSTVQMLFLEDASEYGFQVKAHGRHITLDYTGFVVPAREGGELTMRLMRDAVREAGVREVHSKVVILGEEGESPPGFTAVCLVDESHVTAHCYSDRGWLAIDVFTCGSHPPERIATALHDKLVAKVEGLRLMRGVKLDRFMHHATQDMEVALPPSSGVLDGSQAGRWVEEPLAGKAEIQDWRVGV